MEKLSRFVQIIRKRNGKIIHIAVSIVTANDILKNLYIYTNNNYNIAKIIGINSDKVIVVVMMIMKTLTAVAMIIKKIQ